MSGVIDARAKQTGVTYAEMEKTYLDRISLRRMVTAADVAAALFSVQEVPPSSLTPETLQILGHASKSLRKPLVHKVRDIALARAGQFGVSLRLFSIALCLLRSTFHF